MKYRLSHRLPDKRLSSFVAASCHPTFSILSGDICHAFSEAAIQRNSPFFSVESDMKDDHYCLNKCSSFQMDMKAFLHSPDPMSAAQGIPAPYRYLITESPYRDNFHCHTTMKGGFRPNGAQAILFNLSQEVALVVRMLIP
jgi:hypothetical protein